MFQITHISVINVEIFPIAQQKITAHNFSSIVLSTVLIDTPLPLHLIVKIFFPVNDTPFVIYAFVCSQVGVYWA